MRRVLALVVAATLLVGACGSEGRSESVDTSSEPEDPSSTVVESTTDVETTEPETTTTALSDLPGEPIDLYAHEGGELGVVGVAADDVLNLRTGPGSDFDVVAELEPRATGLIATGNNRSVPNAIWYQVEVDGETGWVNARHTAYIGSTEEFTDELVGDLTAPSADELARRIGEARGSEEPRSDIVVVDRPGDDGEGPIVVDVMGLGDDAVTGERLRIWTTPVEGGGVGWSRIEATLLCTRGLSDEGVCL